MEHNRARAAFYYEIGFTITQWAHVEGTLFNIADACSSDPREQVYSEFLSHAGFQKKREFVTRLVDAKLAGDPARLAAWRSLIRRVDKAASRRNKLAHWNVMGSGPSELPGRRMLLLPWQGDKGTPLGLREIVAIRYRIHLMFRLSSNFYNELRSDPFRFPIDELKVPRLKNLDEAYGSLFGDATRGYLCGANLGSLEPASVLESG